MIPITVYIHHPDDTRRQNPVESFDLEDNEVFSLKNADLIREMTAQALRSTPQWARHLEYAMGRNWPDLTDNDMEVVSELVTLVAGRILAEFGGGQKFALRDSIPALGREVQPYEQERILQPLIKQCATNSEWCYRVATILYTYFEKIADSYNDQAIEVLRSDNAIPMEYENLPSEDLDIRAGLRELLGIHLSKAWPPNIYAIALRDAGGQ